MRVGILAVVVVAAAWSPDAVAAKGIGYVLPYPMDSRLRVGLEKELKSVADGQGVPLVDLSESHRMLIEAIAFGLIVTPPKDFPEGARAAWAQGVAACRLLMTKPQFEMGDADAHLCSRALAPALYQRALEAVDVAVMVVVTLKSSVPPRLGVAVFGPRENRMFAIEVSESEAAFGNVIRRVAKPNGERGSARTVASTELPQVSAPPANARPAPPDATARAPSFKPGADCVLPSAIEVLAADDTLSAGVAGSYGKMTGNRTGPVVRCTAVTTYSKTSELLGDVPIAGALLQCGDDGTHAARGPAFVKTQPWLMVAPQLAGSIVKRRCSPPSASPPAPTRP